MKFKTGSLLVLFFFILTLSPLHAAIKVGIAFFKPPFVLSPSQGFEVDLIQLICKRINEHCNLMPMDPDKFFSALLSKQIDIAVGVVITPGRIAQGFVFSMPYILSRGQFLTLKSHKITSISKLSTLKVGLLKANKYGSAYYDYLLQNYPNFSLVQYHDMEDLITALSNGDIDAAFSYKESADYWLQNGGNQFQSVGKPVTIAGGSAIMALPQNRPLIQRIDHGLNSLEADHTYLNLYNTYFVK